MNRERTRGAVMVETALTVGLSLLLVLATAQMALIGYSQLSADGAAYVAARAGVVDPSASPASVAHSVFSGIAASNIQATPGTQTYQTTVKQSVPGFSLLPGVASTYTVSGADVEFAPSPPPNNTPAFSFGANATLFNYCTGSPCVLPSNHGMYLAQNLTSGGNGKNGQFAEWYCHDGYFDSLLKAFPSTRPQYGITPGSSLDMNSSGTTEHEIYSWDTGAACS